MHIVGVGHGRPIQLQQHVSDEQACAARGTIRLQIDHDDAAAAVRQAHGMHTKAQVAARDTPILQKIPRRRDSRWKWGSQPA